VSATIRMTITAEPDWTMKAAQIARRYVTDHGNERRMKPRNGVMIQVEAGPGSGSVSGMRLSSKEYCPTRLKLATSHDLRPWVVGQFQ